MQPSCYLHLILSLDISLFMGQFPDDTDLPPALLVVGRSGPGNWMTTSEINTSGVNVFVSEHGHTQMPTK